jgi:mercuric ion binding protein
MTKKRSLLVGLSFAAAMAVPHASFAQSKTVVLSMPDMYSPACPILARKVLGKVDGVADVKASLERKEAVVVFDDTKTTVEKLVQTSKEGGFPNTSVRP